MFTGIVEDMVAVKTIVKEQENLHLTFVSALVPEFNIDQSISHNGCCLTVVAVDVSTSSYTVTAIKETLDKTTIGSWQVGDMVNIERCMTPNGRLDGHMVQGHVDTRGNCTEVQETNGSWKFSFAYNSQELTVEKGSIAVNGVSLTVVDSEPGKFSVCIIPYTYEHTNFKFLCAGDSVNLEFDIIGKYVAKYLKHHAN
ncbi:MAG: riboflavin synthase [Bacteroidetes bacterium]|nr:riboflavin synthase [Bacteroidota bacterium]